MGKSLEQKVAELEKAVKELQAKAAIKISKKLGIGDTFEVAGLKWTILDITDKGYVCLADKYGKDVQFDSGCNNWSASDLCNHLNIDLLKVLEDAVGAENIIPFERDLISVDGQTDYGTCEDRVSLLNLDEYRKYRKLIPNTDYYWWLLTPWSTPYNGYEKSTAVVCPSGRICHNCCIDHLGVRPFCIFSSAIFESEE